MCRFVFLLFVFLLVGFIHLFYVVFYCFACPPISMILLLRYSFSIFRFFSYFFIFVVLFVFIFAFLRFTNFGEVSPTQSFMLGPPMVSRLWGPIHGSFYISIEWRLVFAPSIASPNMLSIEVDLIMETMINR